MKKTTIKTIALVLNGALVFILGFYLLSMSGGTEKTGYIDIPSVYNEFTLKKELETRLQEVENQRQAVLDSLKLDLQLLSSQLGAEPDQQTLQQFEYQRQQYLAKQQQFEQENQALMAQYDEQIGVQLNQYVKDFGGANKYHYVFGANGNGAIMYAEESEDLTQRVIEFINNKYAGK